MNYRKQLGNNIRLYRKEKGLTHEQLGEKANLHPNSVAQFERAESEPKIGTLVRLAKALGVKVSDLVQGF